VPAELTLLGQCRCSSALLLLGPGANSYGRTGKTKFIAGSQVLTCTAADKHVVLQEVEGEATATQQEVAADHAAEQPEAASPTKLSSAVESTNSPRAGNSSGTEHKGLGSRASSNNGKLSAAGSEAGLPPIHRQSSNLANRIAAYSSGVAPVRKGITNADEDSITVEEVLHKLETAGRVSRPPAALHLLRILQSDLSTLSKSRLDMQTACFDVGFGCMSAKTT
jgi:hypothetical protein